MLQTHARGQKKNTAFSSYRWLKLILKHITVPFTVTCLSLLQEMFKNNSFMIRVTPFWSKLMSRLSLVEVNFYAALLNSYVCFTV